MHGGGARATAKGQMKLIKKKKKRERERERGTDEAHVADETMQQRDD